MGIKDSPLGLEATRTLGYAWDGVGYVGTQNRLYVFYVVNDPGDCDGSGYSITLNRPTGTTTSSVTGFGACNRARLTNPAGQVNWATLPNFYVGNAWDNNISHIQIYHG